MKRLLFAFAILAMSLAFINISFAGNVPQTSGAVRVGDFAPSFKLDLLDGSGEVCAGKECTGKVKVLVFWTFFCFPCQAEMPAIDKFYHDMKDQGVDVIGIGLDGHEYDNLVMPFIEKHNLTMPLVYDIQTPEFYETAEKYGVVGTPTFFVLDAEARIRFIQLGKLDTDAMRSIVKSCKETTYCPDIVKPAQASKTK